MRTFSRNLNHHWKCREQKENLQAIAAIIFWNFSVLAQVQFTTRKTKLDI